MGSTQESPQQIFKVLLQDIYTIGQETESMRTIDFIIVIQKKLTAVLENKHLS